MYKFMFRIKVNLTKLLCQRNIFSSLCDSVIHTANPNMHETSQRGNITYP